MSKTNEHIWDSPDLKDTVAVVTGASRGIGRGIAIALGDAGATVYVTGRSIEGKKTTENLPGTIEETARLVDEQGGTGIAIRCDHTVYSDIENLVRKVTNDSGIPHILVNNAWAGYERSHEVGFDLPFWKQPQWRWDLFFDSLNGSYVTTQLFAEKMLAKKHRGLIVNISFTDGDIYLGQVPYDVVKHAMDRMTYGMAQDLHKHGVSVVALHPGFVRTERVEETLKQLGETPSTQLVHSPQYVGRAIAELYRSDDLTNLTGKKLTVSDLAQKFDFRDIDGRQPPPYKLGGDASLAQNMQKLLDVQMQQLIAESDK